jgi:hypothetical protein
MLNNYLLFKTSIDIIKICNNLNIVPVIFGSVAYFFRTFDFNLIKYDNQLGFNDLDFIVSYEDLFILKNEFEKLGYVLNLDWIDGAYDDGIKIGPSRFVIEVDNLKYDFDAMDEFVFSDENTLVVINDLKVKIAGISVLKECFNREIICGWDDINEQCRLDNLNEILNLQ